MNIIVICDLSGCKIFSTLSHKRHDCLKKQLLNNKWVLSFLYNFPLNHRSFKQELSEILSYIYIGFHEEYALFLSDVKEARIFLKNCEKFPSNFMKFRRVWAAFFHANRYTAIWNIILACHILSNEEYYLLLRTTQKVCNIYFDFSRYVWEN